MLIIELKYNSCLTFMIMATRYIESLYDRKNILTPYK